MWMRFAVHSDVAFVKGVDQAYYRIHGTQMTTARVPIVDLRQRKDAYDALFAAYPEIPEASRLRQQADRKMAKEALWRACRAYERRRMDATPVTGLYEFARSTYPETARLPEYWGLRWREKVGPQMCPYLQPLMVSAVHRKVRKTLWWRRWERQDLTRRVVFVLTDTDVGAVRRAGLAGRSRGKPEATVARRRGPSHEGGRA